MQSQFVGQEVQPAFKERCPSFHHQRAGGPVKKMRGSIEIAPCQGILDSLLDIATRSVPGCRAPVQHGNIRRMSAGQLSAQQVTQQPVETKPALIVVCRSIEREEKQITLRQ